MTSNADQDRQRARMDAANEIVRRVLGEIYFKYGDDWHGAGPGEGWHPRNALWHTVEVVTQGARSAIALAGAGEIAPWNIAPIAVGLGLHDVESRLRPA